ncbi:MAG: hypothetical protein ACRDKJ_01705 [Actinomycetota bacterium]
MRTAILLAAAGGFVVALSLVASADVVEPSSAYQPASTALLEESHSTQVATGLPAEGAVAPQATGEISPDAEARVEPAPATPLPELQVGPAASHIVRAEPASESVVEKAVRPLGAGLERIGSYLARVVSACQEAASSGAGVPVLALAVLSVAAAFDRRRVLGARTATDEDAPELLYASEVIAPG